MMIRHPDLFSLGRCFGGLPLLRHDERYWALLAMRSVVRCADASAWRSFRTPRWVEKFAAAASIAGEGAPF
jgi:hypothetical protein